MPDVRDVVVVRQAIRGAHDVYQPLDLDKQLQGAGMDVSSSGHGEVRNAAHACRRRHAQLSMCTRAVCLHATGSQALAGTVRLCRQRHLRHCTVCCLACMLLGLPP